MSSPTPSSPVAVFHHPSQFPAALWACLERQPRNSNIVYAHIANIARTRASPDFVRSSDLWIIGWTAEPEAVIAFVLSCTTGPLGPYPIFIYTPLPADQLVDGSLRQHMLLAVRALRAQVPPERVFSVFAVDRVADVFATIWTAETSVQLANPPVYYHAKLLYCTKATLASGEQDTGSDIYMRMRLATAGDAVGLARLCHGFAVTSGPFVLTEEQAFKEATIMIRNNQAWVIAIQGSGETEEIPCTVAVTRTTDTVAAITKVFTDPTWRGRRCAERLVRHVCECLLQVKESVVLYVAHSNPVAEKVYRRVGFVDCTSSSHGPAESWKELGFDRAAVQLGHW
ncbi:hypothetical protein BD414DRAFT_444218 [Trametes punicea]|nr:hypothetical protein BD414DRAFT_444218 [Trametes punicea]